MRSNGTTTIGRLLTPAAITVVLIVSACSGSTGDAASDGGFGEAPDSLAFSTPGGCTGDIVIGLDANLAEGFIDRGGPYPASIPAGTYTVQMESWADMDDPEEPNERWYFTTDAGYRSPTIADPGANHVLRQSFDSQVLTGDASSISIFHMLPGDDVSNSVVAKCVSFTRVQIEETTTTTTTTTSTTAAPTTVAPTTSEDSSGSSGEDSQVGQSNIDQTTSTSTTTATSTTTTTAAPTTAAPTTAPTTSAAAAPTTTASQVANNEEEPATLALTGPSDLAASLALTGAALVTAGYAAIRASRRTEDA